MKKDQEEEEEKKKINNIQKPTHNYTAGSKRLDTRELARTAVVDGICRDQVRQEPWIVALHFAEGDLIERSPRAVCEGK